VTPKRRRTLLATAAVLAAVVFFLLATLPPRPLPTSGDPDADLRRRTVAGAFHVHTTRSDGKGTRADVAAAAARAGLQFVVFTDHGDGTRLPDAPAYLHGVLCLDGVEISTNGGHYVAIDLPATPYPLGGEADAVAEDVARMGGFGAAAHPDSPKPELQWTAWQVPIDGLEWLNLDSAWRDEPARRLVRLPFDYLIRPAPALASMLKRPSALARWDEIAKARQVVGLAGHDAHGGVSWRRGRVDNGERFRGVRIPSYEASFRTFALGVTLPAPLTGHAPDDGRAVLSAIRAGRVFTAITAVAAPAWLDVRARQGDREVGAGDSLTAGVAASFTVRAPAASGQQVVLVCNGEDVASASGELRADYAGGGACRAEVRLTGAPGRPPVPWIVGNHIYLRTPDEPAVPQVEPLLETVSSIGRADWAVEKDPESTAVLTPHPGGASVEYQLRPGGRLSQYVALAVPLAPPLPAFERMLFTARASSPMRLSVQLRWNDGGGERWGRSVYLSPETSRLEVPLDRLVAAESSSGRPEPRRANSILFVVDLTNAAPGSRGRFEISDLALARSTNR
jgi:hypothetical protein